MVELFAQKNRLGLRSGFFCFLLLDYCTTNDFVSFLLSLIY